MNTKYLYLVLIAACLTPLKTFSVTSLRMGKSFSSNGKLTAADKIIIFAGEEVNGKGYMEAPEIEITTKNFLFTGTINRS